MGYLKTCLLPSPNPLVLIHQLIGGFDSLRVFDDAINRADLITGWLIIKAHALGAKIRVNHISFLTFLVVADGIIGAFWLADVAVDTVGGDF